VAVELAGEEDNLRFSLRRTTGGRMAAHLLSGGERHKSGLALLFGMRDLKELYTGTKVNVLIVDEPFGNLDPLGRDSLLQIFVALKARFSSIFVISHRPEILQSDVWDHVFWAIRENHEAKLYLEDPPDRYLQLAEKFRRATQ
jgi:DNA repair exonuclease SbcCD ATPase subunit